MKILLELRKGVRKRGAYFYRTIRIWKEDAEPAEKPHYDEIVHYYKKNLFQHLDVPFA